MGYLYLRILDAEFSADTPERRAFKQHLQMVAEALKAIEWVDSGDWGPGDEDEPILSCIFPDFKDPSLNDIKRLRDDLSALIKKYE